MIILTTNIKGTAAITCAFVLSGCASIVSENSYDVNITSVPDEIPFTITDVEGVQVAEGITPKVVHLNSYAGFFRRANYLVSYTRPDNGKLKVPLEGTFNPTYFLNYPIGAFFGFFIDPFTGAVFDLPGQVVGDMGSLPDAQELVE